MGTKQDIANVVRCLAVIDVQPHPYSMRNLPAEPGEEQRVEDGYGLLMPNKPSPEAETDRHPEFYNKTDLVREPDYGQGTTMNVGINI